MSQLEEPDRSDDDVWQRAADQAGADMRRTRSQETARATFLEKLADLQRQKLADLQTRNGTVTRKEAEELWSTVKVAPATGG